MTAAVPCQYLQIHLRLGVPYHLINPDLSFVLATPQQLKRWWGRVDVLIAMFAVVKLGGADKKLVFLRAVL
jgi:hypothetical protein